MVRSSLVLYTTPRTLGRFRKTNYVMYGGLESGLKRRITESQDLLSQLASFIEARVLVCRDPFNPSFVR
jgi:hypothetical protein